MVAITRCLTLAAIASFAALGCPACLSSVLDGLPDALPADPPNTLELDEQRAVAAGLPEGPLRLELGGVDGAPPFLERDIIAAVRARAGEDFLFYERPGSGARLRLQVFVAGAWGSTIAGTQVSLRTRWELRDRAERALWRMEGYETCQGKRAQSTTRCALEKIAGRVLPELSDFLRSSMRPPEARPAPGGQMGLKRAAPPDDKLGGGEK